MNFRYRLGLDVGTNSLGWSVLALDDSGDPYRIEAAGARIFSDGRADKTKTTLAAERRTARMARRRRDRFKQRQKFLLSELTKAGLFPEEVEECQILQKLNPLELRARALTEKLEPYHIGRALFHLNQRRGFKSNRKDKSEETTSGKVSDSSRALLQKMGLIGPRMSQEEYKKLDKKAKKQVRQKEAENRKQALKKLEQQKILTYGSFLWARQQQGKPTRARPGAGDDSKLYDVYPTRELYEDEFNKICDAQAKHHSNLITNDVRDRIHHVIFTQRPLKPQKRGKCVYLPKEDRTFRAMPGFQRYRIYQEVNNLEWVSSGGKHRLVDYPDARNAIIDMLEKPSLKEKPHDRNAQVGFHKMKTLIKEMRIAEGNFVLNFETPKRKGFDGNQTSNVMQHEDYVGDQWHDWPLEKQDEFISLILDDELSDEIVRDKLKEYGLTEHAAEKCMCAPLVDGTASMHLTESCTVNFGKNA